MHARTKDGLTHDGHNAMTIACWSSTSGVKNCSFCRVNSLSANKKFRSSKFRANLQMTNQMYLKTEICLWKTWKTLRKKTKKNLCPCGLLKLWILWHRVKPCNLSIYLHQLRDKFLQLIIISLG